MLLIYWLGIMLVETQEILSDHKSANDSSIKVQVTTDLYRLVESFSACAARSCVTKEDQL